MIYSRWRSAKGGYDYFEARGRDVPLGNDLPVPRLPSGTSIGVASVEAGRPIPSGAKFVGSGDLARGLVAPTERARGFSGLGSTVGDYVSAPFIWLAAGLGLSVVIRKMKKL